MIAARQSRASRSLPPPRDADARSFTVLCDKNYGAPYISDHYPVALVAEI